MQKTCDATGNLFEDGEAVHSKTGSKWAVDSQSPLHSPCPPLAPAFARISRRELFGLRMAAPSEPRMEPQKRVRTQLALLSYKAAN
jgi:hypothetical protein